MPRRALLFALLAIAGPPPALGGQEIGVGGQEIEIAGRLIDASGDGVAGIEVLLHRISEQGGARVAADTTGREGSFRLTAPGADGMHFAAVRRDEVLFVGPILEQGAGSAAYVIRMEAGHEPGSVVLADGRVLPPGAMGELAAGAPRAAPGSLPGFPPVPSRSLTALVMLFFVVSLTGIALAAASRRRRRERRLLLLELAGIEEELARARTEAGGRESLRAEPGDRESIRVEPGDRESIRAELRDRIHSLSS